MKQKIFVVPDTQVKPDVPMEHLEAAGNYIVEHQPDIIVHLGDHWDFPSLSQYEAKGNKYWEGKRYKEDLEAGYEGFRLLNKPVDDYNKKHTRWKKRGYWPRKVYLRGNHDFRVVKAVNQDPRLEGTIGPEDIDVSPWGWEDIPFLEPITIQGIAFCHYFVNPDSLTSNPVGGTIENKLKLIGTSFTMGHQQKRQYGNRYNGLGKEMHGLVAGAFYQHDEGFLGPQGNRAHWRGCIMKHEAEDGKYDPMFVSLNFLMENYV